MKVLKFNAVWCPGCLVMRPIWQKIKNEYPEIEIEEYDFDSNSEEVEKWNIGNKLPVVIILDNDGREITRIIGEKSKKQIVAIIDEIVVK